MKVASYLIDVIMEAELLLISLGYSRALFLHHCSKHSAVVLLY